MAEPKKRHWIFEALAAWSFFSAWIGGFIGAMTVRYVGSPLAMGAQMWVRFNTEPRRPELPYPVAMTVVLALLPLPLVMRRRWKWATFAALPFFALPWWHFMDLYALAGQ